LEKPSATGFMVPPVSVFVRAVVGQQWNQTEMTAVSTMFPEENHGVHRTRKMDEDRTEHARVVLYILAGTAHSEPALRTVSSASLEHPSQALECQSWSLQTDPFSSRVQLTSRHEDLRCRKAGEVQ
jgi:hypothetical protein